MVPERGGEILRSGFLLTASHAFAEGEIEFLHPEPVVAEFDGLAGGQ